MCVSGLGAVGQCDRRINIRSAVRSDGNVSTTFTCVRGRHVECVKNAPFQGPCTRNGGHDDTMATRWFVSSGSHVVASYPCILHLCDDNLLLLVGESLPSSSLLLLFVLHAGQVDHARTGVTDVLFDRVAFLYEHMCVNIFFSDGRACPYFNRFRPFVESQPSVGSSSTVTVSTPRPRRRS